MKDLEEEIGNIRTNGNGDMIGTMWPTDENLQPYRFKVDQWKTDEDGTATSWLSFEDPSGKVYDNVLQLKWEPINKDSETTESENESEEIPQEEANTESEESPESSAQELSQGISKQDYDIVNMDEFQEVCSKFENRIMVGFPVKSSIDVKLKKIVGSDETTIDLIGLSTNQPSTVALTNLNSVLDDDEFVACLPENEECNYSICDNGNDLIVDEYTDELTPATDIDILNILLSNLVVEQRNIEFILNNLQNKYDVLQTSSSLDGICWQIDDDIKDISDYIKVCGGTVPNLGTLVSNDPYIENVSSDPVMIKQTILECLNSIVNSYKLYGICISTPEINSAIQDKLLRLESMMLTI